MPISRYPRYGEPVVPRVLSKLLKEAGMNGFDDLNSTAWSRFGEAECRRHAWRFLGEIQALGQPFFATFADEPLSRYEDFVPVDQLGLERRTLNCLIRAKLNPVPTGPNGLTIGYLLGLNGFGTKCLVDLAASIEAAIFTRAGHKADAAQRREERQQKRRHPLVRLLEADAVLAKLSVIPGALGITPRDPRLGSQLQAAAPGVPTLEAAVELFQRVGLPPAAATEMKVLLKTIGTMSRAKVEDEVLAVFTAGRSPRDCELMAACLQWRGKRRPTYLSVGEQFGITRERARQVFCQRQQFWAKEKPFAPALDRALAAVQRASLAWAADVERQPAITRLFNEPVSLERLEDFARLLGREPGFVVFGAGSKRSVGSAADAITVSQLNRRARKLISDHGLTTVAKVSSPWKAKPNLSQCVSHALGTLPGFAWIVEAEGIFFVVRGKRDKLWTRIRKVLAVAPRVKLDVLWDAVRRDRRFPSAQLTKEHLLSFCRRHPECRVVGKTVIARNGLSPGDVFKGDEQKLVNLLLQRGPMPWSELFRLAKEAGIGKPSFDQGLKSPAITQLSSGLYGIVGEI